MVAPLTISRRRAPFVIDTDDLKPGAVQELSRLVAAVKAAPPSQGNHLQRAPEAMSYTITVEDSSQTAVFQSRNSKMSPTFAALLEWLQDCAE